MLAMEDLEMDCDFLAEDPIKKFLLHKLDEIRLHNADLEQQLNHRKQVVSEHLGNMALKFGSNVLAITGTWSKVFNHKWILGVFLKNTSSGRVLKDVRPVFQWDCSTPVTYFTKLFNQYQVQPAKHEISSQKHILKLVKALENTNSVAQHLDKQWVFSDKIDINGSVVVCFDKPEFLEKTEYKISGIITYSCGDKQYQLPFPNLSMKVQDFVNSLNEVKSSDFMARDEHAYLSILTANERNSLIVKIPTTAFINLENQLEFECMFLKADVVSKAKVFYVDGISAAVNGCLVVVDKEEKDNDNSLYNMDVYSRNQTSFQLLIHYIQQRIPGIIICSSKYRFQLEEIAPMGNYSSQLQNDKQKHLSEIALKSFGVSLEAQISVVEGFCTKHLDKLPENIDDTIDLDVSIKDYKKFRKHLASLEFEADKLYNDIEKHACKSANIPIL